VAKQNKFNSLNSCTNPFTILLATCTPIAYFAFSIVCKVKKYNQCIITYSRKDLWNYGDWEIIVWNVLYINNSITRSDLKLNGVRTYDIAYFN